jgi:hypothetical protein
MLILVTLSTTIGIIALLPVDHSITLGTLVQR